MTDNATTVLIRKLVGYISDLTGEDFAPPEASAPLLEQAACLLTGALGVLNQAVGVEGLVFCRFHACDQDWCCQLTPGECADRGGSQTGSCGATPCPGVDVAVRSGSAARMAKG